MAKKKTKNSRAASASQKPKVKTAKKIHKASEDSKTEFESLQQTTGKNYEDQVAKARELEDVMGIYKMSPFKTKDLKAFDIPKQGLNE